MSKGRRVRHGYIKSIIATSGVGRSGGSAVPILPASRRPTDAFRSSRSRKPRLDIVFRHELMKRDPLGRELTESIVRLHVERPATKEAAELRTRIKNLETLLIEKYDLKGIFVHPPAFLRLLQYAQALHQGSGDGVWAPYGRWNPIWIDGTPQQVTIRIDLTKITVWHLDELAAEFKSIIRKRLAAVPPELRKARRRSRDLRRQDLGKERVLGFREITGRDPLRVEMRIDLAPINLWHLKRLSTAFKCLIGKHLKSLPPHLRRAPSPLAFLRTLSFRRFFLALQRYDRHMEEGRSFRQIAALEAQERRGEVPRDPPPRRVGRQIRGEDSVEASVQKTYRAIYGALYRARRRRLDAPAEGIGSFSCPDHGTDCPNMSCAHLRSWWARVGPTLPSDRTGTLYAVSEEQQAPQADTQ